MKGNHLLLSDVGAEYHGYTACLQKASITLQMKLFTSLRYRKYLMLLGYFGINPPGFVACY